MSRSLATILFLALAVLLFVLVVAAIWEPRLNALWNLMLSGEAIPRFPDAQGYLAGADALRENGGRFSWDYLAAKGDPYNYPRLWSYLGWFGLGRQQVLGVGVASAALLLIGQLQLLRPVDGRTLGWAAAMLFSPSCLLLLNRANNDVFVFCLLVATTTLMARPEWRRQAVGGGLLLAAACLKLYPIAALAALPLRRGRRMVAGAGMLLVLFALYVLAVREDFGRISANTPRPYHGAYGGLVPTSFVGHSLELRAVLLKAGLDLSSTKRLAVVQGTVRMVSLAAMLLVGGAALLAGVRSTGGAEGTAVHSGVDGVRFRTGAAVYGGTFLIGNNWDYRLVFLSLTVPLLFGWLEDGELRQRRLAAGTLGLIVLCQWGFAAPGAVWAFGLMQVATWTLFAVLAFLFGQVLPEGWGDLVRRVLGGDERRVTTSGS